MFAIPFLSSYALAGNPHVAKAISHAEEAVGQGEGGSADGLVMHAQVSLKHAYAAEKEVTSPHLDAGIRELEDAIAHGKKGHAEIATKHAKSAVMHLQEIE